MLQRIMIRNFKTIVGDEAFGPYRDERIVGITGLNGLGKSNFFDAICFALGVDRSFLRVARIGDVRAQHFDSNRDEAPGEAFCAVGLVMRNEESTITFCRTLARTGNRSSYYIDGIEVWRERYLQQIADLGILPVSKNFVIRHEEMVALGTMNDVFRFNALVDLAGCKDLYDAWKFGYAGIVDQTRVVETLKLKKAQLAASMRRLKEKATKHRKAEKLFRQQAEGKIERVLLEILRTEVLIREADKAAAKAKENEEASGGQLTDDLESEQKNLQDEIESLRSTKFEKNQDLVDRRGVLNKAEGEARINEIEANEFRIGIDVMHEKLRRIAENKKFLERERDFLETGVCELSSQMQILANLSQRSQGSSQPPAEVPNPLDGLSEDQRSRFEELRREIYTKWGDAWPRVGKAYTALDRARRARDDSAKKHHTLSRTAKTKADYIASLESIVESRGKELQQKERVVESFTKQRDEAKSRHDFLMRSFITGSNELKQLKAVEADLVMQDDEARNKQSVGYIFNHLQEKLSSSRVIGMFPSLLTFDRDTRYKTALARAIMPKRGSIIVDTFDTATKCLDILTDESLRGYGMVQFVILNDLPPVRRPSFEIPAGVCRLHTLLRPNNESMGPSSVLRHPDVIGKIIQYFVGNAVVFEDLEAGHKFWNDLPADGRIEVIAMNGDLITRSGCLTIGAESFKKVEHYAFGGAPVSVAARLREVKAEVAVLEDSISEKRTLLVEAQGTYRDLEDKVRIAAAASGAVEIDLEKHKEAAQKVGEDLRKLQQEIENEQDVLEAAKAYVVECKEKIAALKVEMEQVEIDILAPLAEELGRPNWAPIRVSFERFSKNIFEVSAKEAAKYFKLHSDHEKYAVQLDVIKRKLSLLEADKTQYEEEKRKKEAALAQCVDNVANQEVERKRDEMLEVEADIRRLGDRIVEARNKLQTVNSTLSKRKADLRRAQGVSAAAQSELTRRQFDRETLIKKAVMSGLDVPLIRGSLVHGERDSSPSDDEPAGEPGMPLGRATRMDDPVNVDGPADSGELPSQNISTFEFQSLKDFQDCLALLEKERRLVFDYRPLAKRFMTRVSAVRAWSTEEIDEKLEENEVEDRRIAMEISQVLGNARINHEQFSGSFSDSTLSENVQMEYTAATELHAEWDRKFKDARKKLNSLAKDRRVGLEQLTKKFIPFVSDVNSRVGEIFRDLTNNDNAQAELLRSESGFFVDGVSARIIYHVQFPGKRFHPFSDLSGGEIALATLALVFAIHTARKAPFLLLDEVDKNLDTMGQFHLGHYLKELSRDSRIFVISHRDLTLSFSDHLAFPIPDPVGRKERQQQTSRGPFRVIWHHVDIHDYGDACDDDDPVAEQRRLDALRAAQLRKREMYEKKRRVAAWRAAQLRLREMDENVSRPADPENREAVTPSVSGGSASSGLNAMTPIGVRRGPMVRPERSFSYLRSDSRPTPPPVPSPVSSSSSSDGPPVDTPPRSPRGHVHQGGTRVSSGHTESDSGDDVVEAMEAEDENGTQMTEDEPLEPPGYRRASPNVARSPSDSFGSPSPGRCSTLTPSRSPTPMPMDLE